MGEENHKINLTLTVIEINQILEALGQRPYASVFQLIEQIRAQADAQIGAPEVDANSVKKGRDKS